MKRGFGRGIKKEKHRKGEQGEYNLTASREFIDSSVAVSGRRGEKSKEKRRGGES